MLGWNSRLISWVFVQAQLCCRDTVLFIGTLKLAPLSSGFVITLSRQLLMLLFSCVCRNKVVKCRDIDAVHMSSIFVASLSRHCGLTFFLNDCHDKLFIIFSRILSSNCRDKVQLIPPNSCRDKVSNVVTCFPCLALLISGGFVMTKSYEILPAFFTTIFSSVTTFLLQYALCFVKTMISMSRNSSSISLEFLLIFRHDILPLLRQCSTGIRLDCVTIKLRNVTTKFLLLV